jgi:hypothetical protein
MKATAASVMVSARSMRASAITSSLLMSGCGTSIGLTPNGSVLQFKYSNAPMTNNRMSIAEKMATISYR